MPQKRGYIPDTADWNIRKADTDLYRQIYHHHNRGNEKSKNTCLAQLSTRHARVCAKILLRHEDLAAAFAPILEHEGLRYGFALTRMHKVVYLRCPEQIINYLNWIPTTWSYIEDGRPTSIAEVRVLERRCPRYSKRDADEILSEIHVEQDTWSRLLTVPTLIPSLDTFFQDFLVLEACAKCMHHLVTITKIDKSIQLALKDAFGAGNENFDAAQLELWLFARREFKDMQMAPKGKDTELLAKGGPERADEEVLHRFAVLALTLGFSSPKILRLKGMSAERLIGRNALLQARKPELYNVTKENLDKAGSWLVNASAVVKKLPTESSTGDYTQRPLYRSGFPDASSFKKDKKLLFIDKMSLLPGLGADITTLFVLKSVFHAFFGGLNNLPSHGNAGDPPLPVQMVGVCGTNTLGTLKRAHDASSVVEQSMQHNFAQEGRVIEFKTLVETNWTVISKVESASRESTATEATRLRSQGWELFSIRKGNRRLGPVAPMDCYHEAGHSGIDTIILTRGTVEVTAALVENAARLYDTTDGIA